MTLYPIDKEVYLCVTNEWVIYGGEDSWLLVAMVLGVCLFKDLFLQANYSVEANELLSISVHCVVS